MSKLHSAIILTLALLLPKLQISLACGSTPGKCTQSSYFAGQSLAKPQPEDLKNAQECDVQEEGVASSYVIKFRVQARGLTSGYYNLNASPRPPNSYAKVVIDGGLNDNICKVMGHQNPNYSEEFTVNYYDGKESVVKVEMWSQEMDEFLWQSWPVDTIFGHAIFYVKDMLKTGRVLEAPLWYNENSNFNTGWVQLSVSSCQKLLLHQTDEL